MYLEYYFQGISDNIILVDLVFWQEKQKKSEKLPVQIRRSAVKDDS